jgi:hypothetical protein
MLRDQVRNRTEGELGPHDVLERWLRARGMGAAHGGLEIHLAGCPASRRCNEGTGPASLGREANETPPGKIGDFLRLPIV